MATANQIREASRMIGELEEHRRTCKEVVVALIQTHQRWFPGWSEEPSDFRRARRQVIKQCKKACARISVLRRDTFSGDLIRVEALISRMLDRCRRCPQENHEREKNNQPFVCLIEGLLGSDPDRAFRFRLNGEGGIVEQK